MVSLFFLRLLKAFITRSIHGFQHRRFDAFLALHFHGIGEEIHGHVFTPSTFPTSRSTAAEQAEQVMPSTRYFRSIGPPL